MTDGTVALLAAGGAELPHMIPLLLEIFRVVFRCTLRTPLALHGSAPEGYRILEAIGAAERGKGLACETTYRQPASPTAQTGCLLRYRTFGCATGYSDLLRCTTHAANTGTWLSSRKTIAPPGCTTGRLTVVQPVTVDSPHFE